MNRSDSFTETEPMNGTLVQVAHLYYDENLSQQEIADRLVVSRPLIAQYLKRAREAGIVRIQIIDPVHKCMDLAASLIKESGVKRVTVIPNPHGSPALAYRAVAAAAADAIVDALKEGDTLGLAWGRTTTAVVDLLKPPQSLGVDILPLMGESGHTGMHSQMSQLVMQAAEHLQATPYFLSLPMVVSTPMLRDLLVKETGISDVIKLWNRVSLACVGIGVVPPVPGMVPYIGEAYLPRLFEAGAIGDICGTYFDRDGRIVNSGLEDRMIAINAGLLKKCGRMMAVACGKNKADAVLGALRTGLVTDIFIDQEMADRILTLTLPAPGKRARKTA